MYPYIHLVLPSYAVMAFLGGFAVLCLVFFRLDRFGVTFSEFIKLLILSMVGGYLGSKLLFALTRLSWLVENFSLQNMLMLLFQGGLVFYGGLFGVIFALLIATRKNPDLRSRVFQLAVPAMPLFHVFGRVGCFLAGCCYGIVLPTAVSVGFITFVRIPIQLIEALAELLIFIIVMLAAKAKKSTDLLRLYLTLYACVRFADEFLRGDEIRGIFFGLSTAQWISLVILAFYLIRDIIKRFPKKEALS